MEIVNVMRFKISPDQEQEMHARRTTLLAAVHDQTDGLIRAILTRVDEDTWMDLWHWDSEAALRATQQAQLPAAKEAFALVEILDSTLGHITA